MKLSKAHTAALAAATLVLGALSPSAHAQANSPQLAAVLKQMDTASKTFKSAQASFKWDYYEKVVHDTSTQMGSIYFIRGASSTDMGAVIVAPDTSNPKAKPAVQTVIQYKAGTVQMFSPGVDQITVIREGASQSDVERYLTLGFGASGSDLARAWTITDLGPETLSDEGKPVKTEKLDLVGHDADSRKNFSHITIWVDPARAISIKQIFYTPSGNYRTATYSHIQLNAAIDRARFEIKKDKNTTVVNH